MSLFVSSRKIFFGALVSSSLMCVPFSLYAQNDQQAAEALNATHAFVNKIDHIQNFHADFKQLITSTTGQSSESQGEMWVSKPSYFKWAIHSPNHQLLVSNGTKLWNYDKDLAQVTVQSVPRNISEAPYLLLLNGQVKNIEKLFQVQEKSLGHYHLTPKGSDHSLIEFINVVFDDDYLKSLEIKTATGQVSQITFSHQNDAKIPTSTYSFTPPKGVDVLGG